MKTVAWKVPCKVRIWIYRIAKTVLWSGDSRPSAMYRRNRQTVAVDENELLYLRWYNDYFDEQGLLRPANIFIPDQSMNRSNFGGRFWHVLIPDPHDDEQRAYVKLCMGVVRVGTADVSLEFEHDYCEFVFRVEHDPLDYNYGHCELRVYRDGRRLAKADADRLKGDQKKAWTAVKKLFRAEVAKAVRNKGIHVMLWPEVGTRSVRKS